MENQLDIFTGKIEPGYKQRKVIYNANEQMSTAAKPD